MKSILKAALAAGLAGWLVGAFLKKLVAEKTHALVRNVKPEDVPTVNPVRDAEPNVDEPLQEDELRVAQNSPL
jgi:hypothetical protein